MSSDRQDAYRGLLTAIDGMKCPESIDSRLEAFVEHAWRHLESTGVSWLGFYRLDPDDPEAMVLGPRRDRPACSPIGLHGVCGQALLGGETRIGDDVLDLGAEYVACDPRDQSEIVIPLRLGSGGPHPADTVLDLDSFEIGAFSDADDHWLRRCLDSAGLSAVGIAGTPETGNG